MAKENEELIVDVQEVYSKSEKYVEDNKNSLTIIVSAIVLIVGIYYGYTKMYLAPLEVEATEAMWKAEQLFEQDSFKLAIAEFEVIADDYGVTKAGNLANYYLGVSHLRSGNFQEAIDYLSSFDATDAMVGPVSQGAIGDCHVELGDAANGASFYEKAANMQDNDFLTPLYLFKAGNTYESINEHSKAVTLYEKIKKNYPESVEGQKIEKYISRAGQLAK